MAALICENQQLPVADETDCEFTEFLRSRFSGGEWVTPFSVTAIMNHYDTHGGRIAVGRAELLNWLWDKRGREVQFVHSDD